MSDSIKKVCTKCGEEKDLDKFYNLKAGKYGKASRCKVCADIIREAQRLNNLDKENEYSRNWAIRNPEKVQEMSRKKRLKLKFKMTVEEYENVLLSQNSVCAICGGSDLPKRLAVDHDRSCCPSEKTCGKCIRGLLCSACNISLGGFKDEESLLLSAIEYLRNWAKKNV